METKTSNTIERKEFMKQVGLSFGAIMLMNCLQACDTGDIPDPTTPNTNTGKLDITLDLNTTTYSSLLNKGGFVVVSSKGVIVAHTSSDTFIAVASACTHEGTTIGYRASSNDFLCPNHQSVFTSTGAVQTGPATKALTKYNTSYDATSKTLRVFA